MGGSLKEIARLTGVAASSVSRALADKPGVSAEKRREILEIATRLGYRPNPDARALRTGRAADLLVILQDRPSEITSYRNHALLALGGGAFDRVRVAVVSKSEPLETLLARAAEEGVTAVIASGVEGRVALQTRELLRDARTAVVCLDCTVSPAGIEGLGDSVEIDREVGAYEAARLLLSGGGTGIVFFARRGRRRTDARMKGIDRACREAGRKLNDRMVVAVEGDDFAEGYAVTQQLLRSRRVEGLFCYNDRLAVGALKAISDAGRLVPQEIKVVGFDDLSFAPYLTIPLTTVAQPVLPCVEAAIDLALLRRGDPERPAARQTFKTNLVTRETALWPETASAGPLAPPTAAPRHGREKIRTNVRRTK